MRRKKYATNRRRQLQGETFDSFVADLKLLACGLDMTVSNKLIRNVIACKSLDERYGMIKGALQSRRTNIYSRMFEATKDRMQVMPGEDPNVEVINLHGRIARLRRIARQRRNMNKFKNAIGVDKMLTSHVNNAQPKMNHATSAEKLDILQKYAEDDILISGRDIAHYDSVLEAVLNRTRIYNLKLNFLKVRVRKQQVQYVAHIISAEGLKPDPEKVREVETPLRELTKKDVLFHWDKPQAAAFQRPKDMCCEAAVLSYYDVTKDVTIKCDASKSAKKKKKKKKKNKPLEMILRKPMATTPLRLHAMMLKVSGYDLKVEYLPGKKQVLVDTLSRVSLNEAPPEEEGIQVNMLERISTSEPRLKDLTSQVTIGVLKEHFSQHGIPAKLVSDCGSKYTSNKFETFAKRYSFEHVLASPQHLKANGEAEAAVKAVKSL
ncbi:Transposon Tf2-9 polyprotein [Stylophora pistillata]|uniref:Transposon Tf2-9 polyprotein n=1 Tax=Stylophora pistillata TaxID=50429 RepID=A0A2B4R7S5_STYPI|nr:Transposon Tf2-9 polyprotein [Stylophora pistillata]